MSRVPPVDGPCSWRLFRFQSANSVNSPQVTVNEEHQTVATASHPSVRFVVSGKMLKEKVAKTAKIRIIAAHTLRRVSKRQTGVSHD